MASLCFCAFAGFNEVPKCIHGYDKDESIFIDNIIFYLEPEPVSGLRVIRTVSTAAQLSWVPVSCQGQRGPFVGYGYELANRTAPTDHLMRSLTNETTVFLTSLVPFTNYSVALWFSNGDYESNSSVIDFTTDEDGKFIDFTRLQHLQ